MPTPRFSVFAAQDDPPGVLRPTSDGDLLTAAGTVWQAFFDARECAKFGPLELGQAVGQEDFEVHLHRFPDLTGRAVWAIETRYTFDGRTSGWSEHYVMAAAHEQVWEIIDADEYGKRTAAA